MPTMFNIVGVVPFYQRITTQPSLISPGKMTVYRNGVAMVVEPSGTIRDLRPGESADSLWCRATLSDGMLVYDAQDANNPNAVITMFRYIP